MFQVIGARGSGKTKKLLQYAKDNNCMILCKDPEALLEKSWAYGITGLSFRGYYGFILDGNKDIDYVIDDLDEFLKYYFYMENIQLPKGYTLTIEE